VEEIRRKGEGG
jgi:hypothetical protein